MNLLRKLFAHNWLAIIYFNFRMLPWRQAVKLPFDFYHTIRFEDLSGQVILEGNLIYRGMVKIGGRGSEMFTRQSTIIDIKGRAVFSGVCEFGHGTLLRIEKTGCISFGNHVRIGALSKIFCCHQIDFGDEIDFSWECQIFDTNFHFIRDRSTHQIEIRDRPIFIGSCNWIGNRVTVMKGTKTPDHFIVASNSHCSKDYTEMPPYSIVGGIPARLITSGKERVFENLENVAALNSTQNIQS